MPDVQDTLLGKKIEYIAEYCPSLLFPISRSENRKEIGIGEELPFHGSDVWYGYEISWLNLQGRPEIGIFAFIFPAHSPFLIESKSFKYYLNSLNQSRFPSCVEVEQVLERDLSKAVGARVQVELIPSLPQREFPGMCLDLLDIAIHSYTVDSSLLHSNSKERVEERVFTHLFKSNCLVTGQPDWASIWIHYVGAKIEHASLLRYLISFRQHQEFHEQCIERIYMDLMHQCHTEKLTVFGKYTRRGGLDINPFRSNFERIPSHFQTVRQ